MLERVFYPDTNGGSSARHNWRREMRLCVLAGLALSSKNNLIFDNVTFLHNATVRPSDNGATRPKIADLFSGVGGFSLGAARVGFDIAVAIDLDRHAIASHKKNFPKTEHARRNIAKLSGDDLLSLAKLNAEKLAGIVGGPPCQGFSPMGSRRKNDRRNSLFFHFFRLVSEIKPSFYVAENVPGILNEKYDDLVEESLSLICDDYDFFCFNLCARDFGAATNRTRVFFIGTLNSLRAALSTADFSPKNREPTVSVRLALDGLSPRVLQSWQSETSSWRKIGSSDAEYVRVINRMCDGLVGDKDAIARFREKGEVSGCFGTRHDTKVVKRFSKVGAGGADKISRFPRLSWDGLCPTLRAGTDRSLGSYQAVRPIHPDRNRVITPREAARLQGFPDWFQFSPTKWHSFRQIGNSVSPLVAEALLNVIHCKLLLN
jgi:DNA (cytosine-5)-methyltransferase 1